MIRFSLIIMLASPTAVFAEYIVTEILFIPWGEGPNELEIWEPYLEYHDGPEIDTIGHLEAAGGPSNGFVDRQENIYFISYTISYLKGFNLNGEVIVNYSHGKTEFNWEFFRGMFNGFYVDSLGRIYCDGNDMRGAYIAVADRNNNLLDKLNPLGVESGVGCTMIGWGSDDVLTLLALEGGNYTYSNGQFYEGGSMFWRAGDGYYYSAKCEDPSSLRFIRFANPDTAGRPASADTTYVAFEPGDLEQASLLGVDDSLHLYVKYRDSSHDSRGIRIYDLSHVLLDEFRLLPRQENQYLIDTPYPFLRHDGNVYEFHCRDDGMHVFRWSEQ